MAAAGERPAATRRVRRPAAGAQDRVRLTDLEVISRFSLAVRSASAPREEVVAALEADLAALRGERARRPRA